MPKFIAFQTAECQDNTFSQEIVERHTDDLPAGEVLIRVQYSSLNYKDALSATGNKGVTRNYPHTAGIDAAGIVVETQTTNFQIGDKVLVTGFDLGMNTSGGFAEYVRVPSHWVLKLPRGLNLKESMVLGTAGFTAAQCIDKLLSAGIRPQSGKIVVTGATGGVGSMAVAILVKLGFDVVGITGKSEGKDFLLALGAKEALGREAMSDFGNRPLLKGVYAGAVDTVGGNTLATLLKSMQYGGVVTCCGLVQSSELNTSVFPFILRGVSLIGIDSAEASIQQRQKLWKYLARIWKPDFKNFPTKIVTLKGLLPQIRQILDGKILGRVVVKV